MDDQPRLPDAIETIPEGLAFWASRTPDAPALRAIDGRELSHGALWEAVAGVARELAEHGAQVQDRVAHLLSPSLEAAIAVLGAMTAAVAVPLNPMTSPHELSRDLERLPSRLLVTGGASADMGTAVAAGAGMPTVRLDELVGIDGDRYFSFPQGSPLDAENTAIILHTSGTTGLPKRVLLSHRALVAGARAARHRLELTTDDVLLLTAALHTVTGPGNMLASLLSGGCCVAALALDPFAFPRWLSEHRPTWMVTTPTELNLIHEAAAASGVASVVGPESRLRIVMVGAQPLTPETAARAERSLGASILERYGMTEVTYIAWSGPLATDHRRGSCGRPLAVAVRLLDDAGRDVAPGAVGEVVVRGATLFSGYLDDAEANAAAFLPGGWFRTGDVGYFDDDGFLFLTGRIKEQINCGGDKIAPAEVDSVLSSHLAVAEAAVFGVTDRRLGEDVVAAVVLRPGMTATARELRRWMLDRLARYKVPRRIWFVSRLPRTATGKVQRGELARAWAEARDGRPAKAS
jgi:acyl-CoA synthetase (AMP-forming)/AMP-acid ligase II